MKPIHLRTARERAGMTQGQLEAKSGVAQGQISTLERMPNARPSFDTVMKLAAALDVDPSELRFGLADGEAVAP